MRFLIVSMTAAAVVSVNATIIGKRDISEPAQQCFDKLKEVTSHLEIVTKAVDGYTSKSGYFSALTIQSKEKLLEDVLRETSDVCCHQIDADFTNEELETGASIVTLWIDSSVNVLHSIETKKTDFTAISLTEVLVTADIKSMDGLAGTLLTCISQKAPKEHDNTFKDLSDKLKDGFSSVRSAYGIETN